MVACLVAVLVAGVLAHVVREVADAPAAAAEVVPTGQVATGPNRACYLSPDSQVRCWGVGVLGDGGNYSPYHPQPEVVRTSSGGPALTGVVAIAVGSYQTCAVMRSGAVLCWGSRIVDGQLHSSAIDYFPTPMTNAAGTPLSGAVSVSMISRTACATMANQTVQCWGVGYWNNLGRGTGGSEAEFLAAPVVENATSGVVLAGVRSVSVGANNACAVMTDTTVKCWGATHMQRLGIPTYPSLSNDWSNPVNVVTDTAMTPMVGAKAVSIGGHGLCANMLNGTLRCWGSDWWGTSATRWYPQVMTGFENAGSVSVGGSMICAQIGDGIKCSGSDYYGQLGRGVGSGDSSVPVSVVSSVGGGPIGDVYSLSAGGGSYACLVHFTGIVKCWGDNGSTQLGVANAWYGGGINSSNVPISPTGLDDPSVWGFSPGEMLGRRGSTGVVGDPVNSATGNFFDSIVDLPAASGVFGLDVVRSYNSLDLAVSSLGRGWRAGFSQSVDRSGDDRVLTLQDGRQVTFEWNGTSWDRPLEFAGTIGADVDGSAEVSFPDGSMWQFDVAGRLESMTASDGQAVTVSLTGTGEVSTVVSSTGPSLLFDYLPSGRLDTIYASDGRTVSYGYDTAGNLRSVTDPNDATTTIGLNGVGQVETITDPTGVVLVSNTYDDSGRIATQMSPSGSMAVFTYDPVELTTTVTIVPGGEAVTYHHDTLGRLIKMTDDDGNFSTRSYDPITGWQETGTDRTDSTVESDLNAQGLPESITKPGVGETTIAYDEFSRPEEVNDPVTGTTMFEYDLDTDRIPSLITDHQGHETVQVVTDGLLVSSTDADGVWTTFTYTPERQIDVVTTAAGATDYDYDDAGRVDKITAPGNRVSEFTYDDAGRTLTATAPDDGETVNTYDDAGRLLTTKEPTDAVTTYTYNTKGQVETVARPGKPASTIHYDDLGQPIETELPEITGTPNTDYGMLGRVDSTTDATDRTTAYEYDDNGRVKLVTAPDDGETETIYTSAGQVERVIDPLDHETVYDYLPNGLIETITDPENGVTAFEYDTMGRLHKTTDPAGVWTEIGYTDAGRRHTVTTPAGTTTYEYDLAGRLETVTDPLLHTTTTAYNVYGDVDHVTSPEGEPTAYTYDDAGRVHTVTDPAGVVTTTTWSKRGELLTEQSTGRSAKVFTYNPDGTLHTATDPRGKLTTYGYDDLGRRTTQTNHDLGVEAWDYDDAGRLDSHTLTATGAPGEAPRTTATTFDAAGRVDTVTDPTGRVIDNTYDLAGRLTARTATHGLDVQTYAFGYDDANRMTTATGPAGNEAWTYDPAGRLASATAPGGRVTTYSYDTAGRATTQTMPDGTGWRSTLDAKGRVTAVTPTARMAETFTDSNGAAPDTSKWTRIEVNGATSTIDSNELKLTTATGAGSYAGVRSKTVDDIDMRLDYTVDDTTAAKRAVLRLISRNGLDGHYRVEIPTDSTTATVKVETYTGGTVTLGTFTIPTPVAGAKRSVHMVRDGSALGINIWDPAAGSEPGSPMFVTSDPTITTPGSTMVTLNRAAAPNTVRIDNYTETTPGTPPAAVASYTYNDDDQILTETLPGGSRGWTYTDSRVTTNTQTLSGASRTTTIGYDTAGAVNTQTTGSTTTTYAYDTAGQLTREGTSTHTWGYDNLGRRTTQTTASAPTLNYTYNSASQLTAITPTSGTATSIDYDAAGRRTAETTGANTVTYDYDPSGRLETLSRTTSGVTDSQTRNYDIAGRITAIANTTSSGTAVTRIDWDHQPIPQVTAWQRAGATTSFATTPTGHVVYRQGAGDYGLRTDAWGSVTVTSNNIGQTTSYQAMGNPATVTAATSTLDARLGYRGELTLGGLTNLRSRDHHSVTGQFTSVDPITDTAATPTVGNPYHYTHNNPLNLTDPTGLNTNIGDSDFEALFEGWEWRQSYNECEASLWPDAITAKLLTQIQRTCSSTAGPLRIGGMLTSDYVAHFCGRGNATSCLQAMLLAHGMPESRTDDLFKYYCKRPGDKGCPLDGADRDHVAEFIIIDLPIGVLSGGLTKQLTKAFAKQGIPVTATNSVDDVAGAACRTNSFIPSTLVLMADGSTKPIEDVEIGDLVLATDPETGEQGPRRVTDLIVGEGVKELVDVEVDGEVITATDGHPFWVDDEGRWVDAQDLQAGDQLLLADGATVAVDSVRKRAEVLRVHNLTVEGIHTYHVLAGDQEVLVHNCSPRAFDIADKTVETHGLMGFKSADDMASYIDDVVGSQRGVLRDDGALLYRDGDNIVIIPDSARTPGTLFSPDDPDLYWERELERSVYGG